MLSTMPTMVASALAPAVAQFLVISFTTDYVHKGSRRNLLGENPDESLVKLVSNELQVTARTPPTFLVHTSEDAARLDQLRGEGDAEHLADADPFVRECCVRGLGQSPSENALHHLAIALHDGDDNVVVQADSRLEVDSLSGAAALAGGASVGIAASANQPLSRRSKNHSLV